jgi:HEAT repeat protein
MSKSLLKASRRIDGGDRCAKLVAGVEKLGEPITLRAGEHDLIVKRGDVVLETRKFTVYRGANPAMRVLLKKTPPSPVAGGTNDPQVPEAPAAVKALIQAVRDEDANIRKTAAASLAGHKHKAVVAVLGEALLDKSGPVRRVAAESLHKLGDKAAAPALVKAVVDNEWLAVPWALHPSDGSGNYDPAVRNAALDALKALAPERVTEALLGAARSKQTSLRLWAYGHLGSRNDDKAVVQALTQALSDQAGPVRRVAAESLKKLGDKSAAPALLKAVADDHWLPYPRLIGPNDGSGNYDPVVRNAVLDALKALAPEIVPEALQAALKSQNANVRAWAVEQLANQKDKK